MLVVSDGIEARIGSLTADRERFMPWRTIDGRGPCADERCRSSRCCIGAFSRSERLPRPVRVFHRLRGRRQRQVVKKIAGYHQFHAVNRRRGMHDDRQASRHRGGHGESASSGTRRVRQEPDDGVLCRAASMLHPEMENPTLVVLTDRNDLDDQLFGTFSRCHELLRQKPVQAETATHLRKLLEGRLRRRRLHDIQKFFPEEKGDKYPLLSDRRNIVVIADEAHRSQYDFIDGFARHMRDALPERIFHRLHRNADRDGRQEHAGGVRRLHQHLRHPARRGRQGDGADLLRKPAGEAGAEATTRGRRSTPISRRRLKARRLTSKEKLKTKWARTGGDGRRGEAAGADRQGHGEALRGRGSRRWTARR